MLEQKYSKTVERIKNLYCQSQNHSCSEIQHLGWTSIATALEMIMRCSEAEQCLL